MTGLSLQPASRLARSGNDRSGGGAWIASPAALARMNPLVVPAPLRLSILTPECKQPPALAKRGGVGGVGSHTASYPRGRASACSGREEGHRFGPPSIACTVPRQRAGRRQKRGQRSYIHKHGRWPGAPILGRSAGGGPGCPRRQLHALGRKEPLLRLGCSPTPHKRRRVLGPGHPHHPIAAPFSLPPTPAAHLQAGRHRLPRPALSRSAQR
jgi:hypothetical protein